MPNFRSTYYPSADDSSLVPGQIAPTLAAASDHQANSRTNVPDPRRNPPPVSTPTWATPRSVKGFRAPTSPARPRNNEDGVEMDAPTSYAWGNQSGGAPVGVGSDHTDEDAHKGFDPVWGTESDLRGVGLKDYGNYTSALGTFIDTQSHEVHPNTQNADPRHDNAYLGSPVPDPNYETTPNATKSTTGELEQHVSAQIMYEKPYEWFLRGRPAKDMTPWLYLRPFDQWAAHNFTGVKIKPLSPPSVGGSDINVTPRASLPIRTYEEDDVPGDAYPGPSFAAPGMNPVGPARNTWRLQPERWDEYLIDTGAVQ